MFLSARSIAARRLAFSLASDSAHARKSEINKCSLIKARSVVADQRCYRFNRFGQSVVADDVQPRIAKPSLNAIADGPDLRLAGQSSQYFNGMFGNHIIESPYQALV